MFMDQPSPPIHGWSAIVLIKHEGWMRPLSELFDMDALMDRYPLIFYSDQEMRIFRNARIVLSNGTLIPAMPPSPDDDLPDFGSFQPQNPRRPLSRSPQPSGSGLQSDSAPSDPAHSSSQSSGSIDQPTVSGQPRDRVYTNL